jgi:Uma2 family endonuclease
LSEGKRDGERDYDAKRREYLGVGVKEYWLNDRFERILTVYSRVGKKSRTRVVRESEAYETPLLSGFSLPLARLFVVADRWKGREEN